MTDDIRISLKKNKIRLYLLLICTILLSPESAISKDKESAFFTVDNPKVNRLIIKAYEENKEDWNRGQLYLVGVCYVAEKKIDEAQKIFEDLTDDKIFDARHWRALGHVYQMKTETKKAINCYDKAWNSGRDIQSLTLLAALYIQSNDSKMIEPLLNDLIIYQRENLDIQKVLLSYSLMVENNNDGEAIYNSVIKALSKKQIAENKDLRTLLIKATLRYKDLEN